MVSGHRNACRGFFKKGAGSPVKMFALILLALWGCSSGGGSSDYLPPDPPAENKPTGISVQLINLGSIADLVIIRDMIALPDNKLLATGFFDEHVTPDQQRRNGVVIRFLSDGSLDPSFGYLGAVSFRIEDLTTPFSLLVNADDSILVAGSTHSISFGESSFLFGLTSKGLIDTSFGLHGLIKYQLSDRQTRCTSLGVQSDHKIVLGCRISDTLSTTGQFALVRFNPGGSLDPSFTDVGAYLTDVSGFMPFQNLLVLADDSILVGLNNEFSSESLLSMFNSEGMPELAFGDEGSLALGEELGLRHLLRTRMDHVLIAGWNTAAMSQDDPPTRLQAYDSMGDRISSFGVGGDILLGFSDKGGAVFDLGEDADGRILVLTNRNFFESQMYSGFTPEGIQLARLNKDGSPDEHFGESGRWIYDTPGIEQGEIMAVLPDGTIFIAGTKGNSDVYEETLLLRISIETTGE